MNRELIALVRDRARNCCEYCRMPADFDDVRYEIDHVIALVHLGETVAENLALACWPCNSFKGTNLSGIDPVRRRIVRLFNPRRDDWHAHFEYVGPVMVGRTSIGRATVAVLRPNELDRRDVRAFLIEAGQFPPT